MTTEKYRLNDHGAHTMLLSASEELEKMAVKCANEAILYDKQGARSLAVSRYDRSIEILLKLCTLYPEAPQTRLYTKQVESYKHRIQELKDGSVENEPNQTTKTIKPQRLALTEKPNIKWNEIAGIHDAKKAIEEAVVFPIKRPDLFPLGWPRGILFFGPPGCGKTLLAAAIATEIDAVFYNIDAASIMSKWLGESEKNVSELFSYCSPINRKRKTWYHFHR